MAYLDVISLETAKNYLGIDDTLTEDDNDITRMIKGALMRVEKSTNILVYARDKNYLLQDCECRVYDYPINTLNTPIDAEAELKPLYSNYSVSDSDVDYLSLNVGYTDTTSDDLSDLIDVALEIVEINYYGEKERGASKKELSNYSKEILHINKRFLL